MTREPDCAEIILLLTNKPDDKRTMMEWRPFAPGNTLEDIVSTHNRRCREGFASKTPNLLAECVQKVKPHLNILALEFGQAPELDPTTFDQVKIILLDLYALGERVEKLEQLREKLSHHGHIFHLIQVSKHRGAESAAEYLDHGACVLLTDPEVFHEHLELEGFLDKFCEAHGNAWHGVAQSPFDTPCTNNAFGAPYVHPRHSHFMTPDSEAGQSIGEAYQAYYEALPKVVADARDSAMVRMLSEAQTANLGRATAIQEFLLALMVAQLRPRLKCPVSVDALRKPLFEIPADAALCLEDLKQFKVLLLQLTHSRHQPTPVQYEQLASLDLLEKSTAVVHFDRPELWQQIEILQDLVSATSLTVELPCWAPTPTVCEPGLSETALGVSVIT